MKFVLTLDLTDHRPGNMPAERAKVREILGLAMQAIGSSSARSGDLTIPVFDASLGVNRHANIGNWEFSE